MQTDAMFMELAIKQALTCGNDVPVGSIVVFGNEIIGRGFNVRERDNDPAGHAEILALREAAKVIGNWRLDGATLYCTLEPCAMCAEAMIQSRISRVVFAAYDPISGAAGSAFNLFVRGRALPLPEVIGGILEERCRAMILQFFHNRREEEDRV
ncbi:MAG: nucleoside deaminase [Candidatus Obscuribacterales bacterium]|nr:nucleoside deaminase [Candidatus Obscuribacterales bacterium]